MVVRVCLISCTTFCRDELIICALREEGGGRIYCGGEAGGPGGPRWRGTEAVVGLMSDHDFHAAGEVYASTFEENTVFLV